MDTAETESNYTRIYLLLVKGGTMVAKRLFLQRVKDLSPQGTVLTVEEFLSTNKAKLLKSYTGKHKEHTLYPSNGRTNVDEWDLRLLCFVLAEVCDLSILHRLNVEKLQKMRNKLVHLPEPTLSHDDFEDRLQKIKIIFQRSQRLIKDKAFEDEIDALVAKYETETISINEIVNFNHNFLRSELERIELFDNEKKLIEQETEHSEKLTLLLRKLDDIDKKLPLPDGYIEEPKKGAALPAPEGFGWTCDQFIDRKQQKDAATQMSLEELGVYLKHETPKVPNIFDNTNGKQCTDDLKQQDVGIDPRDCESDAKCIHGKNPDTIADSNDLKGDWHRCLALGNKKYAYRALRKHLLPDQRLLDKLTKHFGRKSKIISDICKQICSHIAAQESSIYDVWPAVKVNCEDIVFVIIVKSSLKDRTQQFGNTIHYSYVKRSLGDVSCEGKDVMKSLEFKEGSTHLSPADYVVLQQSINGNNVELMKRHKRLMMISISSVRSEGHEGSFHKVTFEPCLVLYVLIKGYIPINEDPFETHYSGVSVDVREGMFKLFTGPAGNYHADLKSGCQIVNNSIGTLGGFVDYPGWGTCGLTCAHVVLNPTEMKSLKPKKDNDMDLEVALTGQTVYQPDSSQDSHGVGKVIKAIYREGGGGESGIDIAVFHILQRYPVLGDFPDMKDGSHSTISYDSGKTADITRLGFSDVYKFGAKTDLTTGSVVMEKKGDTMSVRTYEKYIVSNEYDVKLHNLIEIESKPDMSSFAEQGDSGALVFCEGRNKELICVGVVEGGTSHNTCVVMPILPILEQLNLVSLKSFEINRMEQKMAQRGHSLTEMWNQNMSSAYNALESRITESERTTDARIGRSEQAIETRMTQIEQNLQNLVQQESTKTVSEVRNLLQNFMLQISKSSQPNN